MINQDELATKADLEKLRLELRNDMARLEVRIESLDKRLAVIQRIGFIFLALNGSLIATLLWTLATVLVK